MVNSKAKGSQFEREVCRALSKWVTNGKHADCFWRSAMSGGRATVAHRKGDRVRQGGDIASVSPEGHILVDKYVIECKHVHDLWLASFMLRNTGHTAKFWAKLIEEAKRDHKLPMLIAKENRGDIIIIAKTLNRYANPLITIPARGCNLYLFSDVVASKFP